MVRNLRSSTKTGLRQSIKPGLVSSDIFGRATLDLNFALKKNVGPLVTVTRASTGTYVDANGVIQTAAINEPRFDHDPVTGESLGLLVEEARTNLLLNSAVLSTQSVTVAATSCTLSFYGTGTVTLSGASTAGPLIGTGSNERVDLTFTPTAGSLTVTVSGSVTKGQLEEGSFATSYFPTTGSTVTRAADVAEITGSNFSSFHNATEGTYYIDAGASAGTSSAQARGFVVSNGGNTQRLSTNFKESSSFNLFFAAGGSAVALANNISGLPRSIKAAIAYKSGDFRGAHDGQLALASANSLVPSVDQISIGSQNYTSDGYFNGHIKRLAYFPQRLPDAELINLTR